MPSAQLRLFPAPQPLVERLGADWFRELPTLPGIYRFLDPDGQLLYVGKARNLRQRLAAYRSTHQHHGRIVRLIHSASRIEWETLPSESEALAREAEAILRDQPRFNRAGRWKAPPVWFELRDLDGTPSLESWDEPAEGRHGPRPRSHIRSNQALARLLWLACHPDATAAEAPLSLGENRRTQFNLSLPPGPGWAGWIEAWVRDADPAILWELASSLEHRTHGFTGTWILNAWQQASRAAHPAPGVSRAG